jgi:hypothetical protein
MAEDPNYWITMNIRINHVVRKWLMREALRMSEDVGRCVDLSEVVTAHLRAAAGEKAPSKVKAKRP